VKKALELKTEENEKLAKKLSEVIADANSMKNEVKE